MFSNTFKITFRNALRQKRFTFLNLLGLCMGITACLLISLYVKNEISYDTFHAKGDRIYRINQSMIWGDWSEEFSSTGPNVGLAIREDIPEFEQVTRIHESGDQIVTYRPASGTPRTFNEKGFFIAEENFFDIFSFDLIAGEASTALMNPLSIVITQEMAFKYFDKEDPMGKTLEVKKGEITQLFTITGITKDVPDNSHIQFNMLSSMSSYQRIKNSEWSWIWTTFVTYGLLQENANPAIVKQKLMALPPKWTAATMERVFGQTYDQYMSDGRTWNMYMQPISEAYLNSGISVNRLGPSGNSDQVKIFTAVGLLILLLSSINFMNLSTARSANRAKEVGVRKVLGSQKSALMNQFIFESILFVAISTVVALVLSEMSLSGFNSIADKNLSLYNELTNPSFLIAIISFVLVLGFLSGAYPAFYLSSFRPVEVLKGKVSAGVKGKGIRNALVVFQFSISVMLIVGTMFVQKQLEFTTSYDVGYDRVNVLQVHNMYSLNNTHLETFQNALKQKSFVVEAGFSDVVPPHVWNEDKYKAYGPENEAITLNRIRANESYLDLLNPTFLVGRNFEKERATDKLGVILNASAVKDLGWGTPDTYAEDSPVGKFVTYPTSTQALFEVIGVVEDFNHNSLRSEIGPLLIINQDNDQAWINQRESYVSIRLNSGSSSNTKDLNAMIEEVQLELEAIDPFIPFEYSFMDMEFENSFRAELRMGKVLNILTIVAITIACLGLFGLAAFTAEQRKKELGVRKVLGASVSRLVYNFGLEFSLLIIASVVIASPVAYLLVNNWLSDFAYKTPISIWVFVIGAVAALGIGWVTIGYQSYRSATQNPVNVLRNE